MQKTFSPFMKNTVFKKKDQNIRLPFHACSFYCTKNQKMLLWKKYNFTISYNIFQKSSDISKTYSVRSKNKM